MARLDQKERSKFIQMLLDANGQSRSVLNEFDKLRTRSVQLTYRGQDNLRGGRQMCSEELVAGIENVRISYGQKTGFKLIMEISVKEILDHRVKMLAWVEIGQRWVIVNDVDDPLELTDLKVKIF